MKIPLLSGIYASTTPDYRTKYPRNLVPVPHPQGISAGNFVPADGIALFGTGPGTDRGGILWNGTMYRVMGTKLVTVSSAGIVAEIGDVGGSGQVTMDYSFDRLAIASSGVLYYLFGGVLSKVTDPDLGTVNDVLWIDGVFLTTDGTSIVQTELLDPASVNPLKYGSSEADPDKVVGLIKLRNELYVLNRNTIEVFQNVGGSLFAFARVPGALTPKGCIGTFACSLYLGSIAFLGSARNEAPAVWLNSNGDAQKLSTREIDIVLSGYAETQLAAVVMEARAHKGQQHLYLHLPDQCLVYDAAASQIAQQAVWFQLTSSIEGLGQYRAKNFTWAYDRWLCGDPTTGNIGAMVETDSEHFGAVTGWEFGTQFVYNMGNGAIVQNLELIALTGSAKFGAEPVVWVSYSNDGVTWSQEHPCNVGRLGKRDQRIAWRGMGRMKKQRTFRFRGTSDAHIAIAALEAELEPTNG
jgi:Phage stabilisation protein